MRYFLDTEFYEDGKTIDLISIAVVADDGREFYAVSQEAQLHRVIPWVRTNVLPHLPRYGDPAWMPRYVIADALRSFVGEVVRGLAVIASWQAGVLGLLRGLRLGGALPALRHHGGPP